MTSDQKLSDPYEAVLTDLYAQRDQIDQAIAALERLRGVRPGVVAPQVTTPGLEADTGIRVNAGDFFGMTLPDATRKLLAKRMKNLTNSEIIEDLERGGIVMQSENKMNTINSVLTRRWQTVGDVVRVKRGVWGLKEWHPNLRYRPAAVSASDLAAPPEGDEASDGHGESPATAPDGEV